MKKKKLVTFSEVRKSYQLTGGLNNVTLLKFLMPV